MGKNFETKYEDIISIGNLLEAWEEFLKGKKKKSDAQDFQLNLMTNIFSLHNDLENKSYIHGGYKAFNISDPKPRNIHKASVRDRLLHHAVYRILYPYFDKLFISDSYSCRLGKGTHKAIIRFEKFGRKESLNYTKQCFVLKCDIRKFFASIDQEILLDILKRKIVDLNIIGLFSKIIKSFFSTKGGTGLPLGNLTSQLLVNIYMNEFDQWIKRRMKVKFYIRYADDFVIFSQDKDYILELIPKIADFLDERLKLTLHPNKISIKTLGSGMDFLGWVHFPNHRVLRTSTKKKVLKALRESEDINSLISYSGLLVHGNQFILRKNIENRIEKFQKVNS